MKSVSMLLHICVSLKFPDFTDNQLFHFAQTLRIRLGLSLIREFLVDPELVGKRDGGANR